MAVLQMLRRHTHNIRRFTTVHIRHYFTNYCTSSVVCYSVEELRSRYDAKLQHVFLTFFLVYFCENVKIGLGNKKSFVEIKPVSVVEHVEI